METLHCITSNRNSYNGNIGIGATNYDRFSESELFRHINELPSVINVDSSHWSKMEQSDRQTFIIVSREIKLFNETISSLSVKYDTLKSLFNGYIALSSDLLKDINNIIDGIVPESWYGVFAYRFTQCKRRKTPLSFWLKQLEFRRQYLISISDGSVNFKNDVRLNLMLLPLLAVEELTMNDYKYWGICPSYMEEGKKIAVDATKIDDENTAEKLFQLPEDAIIFTNIYIDGAGWDSSEQYLTEVDPLKLYTRMDNIYCTRVKPQTSTTTAYACPFYLTSDRDRMRGDETSNKICEVTLPCGSSNTNLDRSLTLNECKRRGVTLVSYIHPDSNFVEF